MSTPGKVGVLGDDRKLSLCVLPTQCGKTFTTIKYIQTQLEYDRTHGDRSLHIVYTMNTILNNTQFAVRLQDIEKTYGKGSICVFTSSPYEGEYTHFSNIVRLEWNCLAKLTTPRILIMCNNPARHKDGVDFIRHIAEQNGNVQRIFVYYDEIHKYLTPNLRIQIETILTFEKIKAVIGLTATPDRVWQPEGVWSNIYALPIETFELTNYVGLQDMQFVCVDDFSPTQYANILDDVSLSDTVQQTIGFAYHILVKNPDILGPNTRTFIPALARCATHTYIRNMVLNLNIDCVVVIINGTEKRIHFINAKGEMTYLSLISKNEEVCETIARLLREHQLEHRPLVVTGFNCVGTGQTLLHRSLGPFTSIIVGHVHLFSDDLYQLFGRGNCRAKDWGTFVPTRVFCPTISMNICKMMETCAIFMAQNYGGCFVTRDMYCAPMLSSGKSGQDALSHLRRAFTHVVRQKCDNTDKEYKVFDTQIDAIRFARTLGAKLYRRSTTNAPKALQLNGMNPTCEQLIKRMWGISKKKCVRMIPTLGDKWCVYWRPSFITPTLHKC